MDKEIKDPSRLVFDIEADNLLYEATKIHCICTYCYDDDSYRQFYDDNILEGIDYLDSSQLIIGHNICGYDLHLIRKLYGIELTSSPRDTYCMSKMFYPEQHSHGLEFYGKKFNRHKPHHEDWSVFSEEMLHRCMEDVEINKLTYDYFIKKELSQWKWIDALKLEQDFLYDQTMQEQVGLDIDVDLAHRVIEEIDMEVSELDRVLYERLPLKVIDKGPVNKPFKKDGSYSKMCKDWYSYA